MNLNPFQTVRRYRVRRELDIFYYPEYREDYWIWSALARWRTFYEYVEENKNDKHYRLPAPREVTVERKTLEEANAYLCAEHKRYTDEAIRYATAMKGYRERARLARKTKRIFTFNPKDCPNAK